MYWQDPVLENAIAFIPGETDLLDHGQNNLTFDVIGDISLDSSVSLLSEGAIRFGPQGGKLVATSDRVALDYFKTFSFEFLFIVEETNGIQWLFDTRLANGQDNACAWLDGQSLKMYFPSVGTESPGVTIQPGVLYRFAGWRTNRLDMWGRYVFSVVINGVRGYTYTSSAGPALHTSHQLTIGSRCDGIEPFKGWMADFKLLPQARFSGYYGELTEPYTLKRSQAFANSKRYQKGYMSLQLLPIPSLTFQAITSKDKKLFFDNAGPGTLQALVRKPNEGVMTASGLVKLFNQTTGVFIEEKYSDPTTGMVSFDNLSLDDLYRLEVHDPLKQYKPASIEKIKARLPNL